MGRILNIVERNQDRFGNLSFIIEGKFDELTPMGLTERDVSITHANATYSATIVEATVRAGVLTVKLSGENLNKLSRGAKIELL